MGAPTFGQKKNGGGGSGATCATAPELLCRNGRNSPNNDALICLDDDGRITGSARINKGIAHNANVSNILRAAQSIYFNRNVDTIDAIDLIIGAAPHVFEMGQNLVWDSSSGTPCALVYFEFASQDTTQWDVIGSGGILGIFGMLIQPNINGEIGASQMLLGFSELLDFEPIITARGPGCTAGNFGGLFLGKNDITLQALAACDLTVGDVGLLTHQIRAGGDGAVAIGTNFCVTHKGVVSSGGIGVPTIDKDAAVWCPPDDLIGDTVIPLIAGTVMASVFSENKWRALQHAGPGIFGSSATPDAFAVLDLVSVPGTPRTLILPRMDAIDEAAISSPVEGMLHANISTNHPDFYTGGGWATIAFLQDLIYELALTGASNGLVAKTGTGTVEGRTLTTSTTQLFITNGDGVAGDPVIDFVGLPMAVDSVALGAQTADIADTGFSNVSTPGIYRVSVYLEDTTSAIGAGAVTCNIKYTDATGAKTLSVGPVVLTTSGTLAQATLVVLNGTGSITYGVTHTGIFSTADYALFLVVERLT